MGELSLGELDHETQVSLSEARALQSTSKERGYSLPVILKMLPMS